MKIFFLFLFLYSVVIADEAAELENDFLNSLDEVSEIATKTKLNIDDTPSFVTVLTSNKLKKLGIDNVFEALSLVPGVQLSKEATGVPVVVFRGVSQKSEVKLMIDGVAINNSYRGSIYYYLDFPIELIERIEVIRGAGSVLYGSGAMSGVINIITHISEKTLHNKAFISSGTFNSHKGGAILSTDLGETKIALDGYYQKSDKKVFVGDNPSGYSGESDRHLKDYSLGIKIKYENLTLLSRIKNSNLGNAYGLFEVLDTDEDKNNIKNRSIFTQLNYKNNLNSDNKISISAGYINYKQIADATHPAIQTIDSIFEEEGYSLEASIISKSIADNQLLFGASIEHTKTISAEWSAPIPYISDPDLSRNTTSVFLNDIYSVVPNIDISAGLRYDRYSDFGDSYSPNLGIVYRLNNQLKLKALYSHAFRAPSWIEITSNNNLEAESSDSFETGIIFKQNMHNSFKMNFYTTKISDMILKDSDTGKYVQNSYNKFYGTELEYIYSPNPKTELSFLGTYIKTVDENGNALANVAKYLASTSLTYELDSGIILGSLLRYVSSSKRSSDDTRPDMDRSFIFNQTISYAFKDFTASLIVKDLFDAGRYYALPKNSYNKDFDDSGRVILLKASMEF